MRILYVCSDFGIPVYGHKGASIHVRAVSRALVELGHEVRILSPAADRDANLEFTVPVEYLPTDPMHDELLVEMRRIDRLLGKMPTGHRARVAQELRNLLYTRTVQSATAHLAEWAPDAVYERYSLFASGGLDLARQLGVPHLLEVNAPLVDEQSSARGLHLQDVAAEIERRVWCGTDALLVVSEALADRAGRLGVAPDRVHVVANGVDPQRFAVRSAAREARRRALDLGAGPVIGFVGSLKTWHGTDVLLRAFETLAGRRDDARLLIVGDGPMRQELERAASSPQLAGRVHFTGAVDHAEVPELLAAMDVGVAPYLPSDDFYFSPIKVYEYMAAGLPVVASNLGQVADLVHRELLFEVAPGDAGELEQALEDVLRHPDAAARRARRGREWTLQERTWHANARRILDLATLLAAARA